MTEGSLGNFMAAFKEQRVIDFTHHTHESLTELERDAGGSPEADHSLAGNARVM